MAKDEGADRTEPPTQKKLRDARKDANVSKSKELTSTVLVLGWLLGGWMMLGFMWDRLRALFDASLAAIGTPPTGAYRAKGTLTMATADGPRRYEVALVGRRLELRADLESTAPEGLVVIGVDMDDDDVADFLDEAVLRAGETVDAEATLGLHPYLLGAPDASDVEEWIYDEQRTSPVTGTAAMLVDPEDPEAFDPAFTP